MNRQIEQVKEFNKAFKVNQTIEQKKKFLEEELDEYWNGVQFCVHSKRKNNPEGALRKGFTEVFDALLDCKYVLYGIMIEAGLEPVDNKYINMPSLRCEDTDYLRDVYDSIEEWITLDKWENIDVLLNYLLSAHGMYDLFEEGFNEVHASNMSKLDDNGEPIFRKDMKVLKSDNYFRPKLKAILFKTENV